MQTPGHAVVNVSVLGAALGPTLAPPVLAAAILPDVPIFVLYLIERARGTPEERIWSEAYQRPFWLGTIHGAHSFVLWALVIALGLATHTPAIWAFGLSGTLHALGDFPVHAIDAHRHFWPASNYRFISPLSYWDVRFHARKVALVEMVLVWAAALWLWPRVGPIAHLTLGLVAAWYPFMYWRSILRAPVPSPPNPEAAAAARPPLS